MNKITVLIIDDSAFMRKLISEFLSDDPDIEVIATARNGNEGIRKVVLLKPDVITLDVEMPIMNGLEALKQIMETEPTPVVMLSSSTAKGAENTFLAMNMGAFDFIPKPSGTISLDLHKIKEELILKVKEAAKANIANLRESFAESPIIGATEYSKIEPGKARVETSEIMSMEKVICIGTSTGGPRALQQVLTKLPRDIDCPILIVQHMPAGFTQSLANRLDSLCEIKVKEAEDGEVIKKGIAYIAPGGYHLKVKKIGASLAVSLDQTALVNGHRPSVDALFNSISQFRDYKKTIIIMTGMGADGSKGLVQLKNSGNTKAIAEAQESCIVFGMPKAAIATNLVDSIVPVEKIAEMILKFCKG